MTETAADDIVQVEVRDHVAEVRLNRPERMNAITVDLLRALDAAAGRIAADRGVRVVVLSGAGRAFCAGLDTANFAGMAESGKGSLAQAGGDLMDRTHGGANLFQHACMMWRRLPQPVIAALHGHCLGGGVQIALGADVRIAAPDTKMSIMEMKWGLVPDMGGMAVLRHLMRGDVLRRLVFTAEVIDAAAAREHGLVTEVAEDPLAAARALAARVASSSPSAMRAAKALILETEDDREAEILLAESRAQKALIGGADQAETVRAAMEKRPARYA